MHVFIVPAVVGREVLLLDGSDLCRHRGHSVTVDVPDLDRALISYHFRPLRIAGGATAAGTGNRLLKFFSESPDLARAAFDAELRLPK